MAEGTTVVGALGEAPARVELDLGKAVGDRLGAANLDGRRAAIAVGHRHQLEVIGLLHQAQAVLHTEILVGDSDRVAVAVGAATADTGEVKFEQKRIYHRRSAAALAPAGSTAADLL